MQTSEMIYKRFEIADEKRGDMAFDRPRTLGAPKPLLVEMNQVV